jgi:peptidylprolyl isomerase
MAIKVGDVIRVDYEGTLEDGTVFDSTRKEGANPLKFEVGAGQLIFGFDQAVLGKEVGDEFNITIQPKDAYGNRDPMLVQTISREQLPKGLDPEPGMMVGIGDPNGTNSLAWITNVDDEFIKLDMNHPLAGKVLNFQIKILESGLEPDPPDACGCGCDCGHDH